MNVRAKVASVCPSTGSVMARRTVSMGLTKETACKHAIISKRAAPMECAFRNRFSATDIQIVAMVRTRMNATKVCARITSFLVPQENVFPRLSCAMENLTVASMISRMSSNATKEKVKNLLTLIN